MKALVTGGHGFIGSHIVDRLLDEGIEVRVLVSPWGKLDNLGDVDAREGLEVVRADITKPETLAGTCEGCHLLYHSAARVADWGRWKAFEIANVEGTKNVLEEAKRAGVGRWVQVSSVAVHEYSGFRDADPRTTPRGGKIVNYARSKVMAEDLVTQSGLEYVLVRPGLWPFGPRDPNFPRILGPLQAGKFPMVRNGRAVINMAYVENLAVGFHLAGIVPAAAGKTYVIADEGAPTWREVFDYLAELVEAPRPGPSLPCWLSKMAGWTVEWTWSLLAPNREPPLSGYAGELMCNDIHFSTAAAVEERGYRPLVDWREGMRRTVRALGKGPKAA